MQRIRLIGALAHLPIYVAAGSVVTPHCPAAYVALGAAATMAAYFWPVVDYAVVAALATISLTAAVCVAAAAIGAGYLAAAVVERMEEA